MKYKSSLCHVFLSVFQANAFRTLRFLFSMERNRRLFKRLFPPDLFEKFIDIGHYKKDLNCYRPLVDMLNSLSVSMADFLLTLLIAIMLKVTNNYLFILIWSGILTMY